MTKGLLLAQLGTPDAPTSEALRRFLAEFLSDRRVVDYPRWLWWPLLHGIILRTRPSRSAQLYRSIWTEEGSPLLLHSRTLRARLAEELGPTWRVGLGMRYGKPSLDEALREMVEAEVEALVVIPLFPQYSTATTESVFDRVRPFCQQKGIQCREVERFGLDEGYLLALQSIAREAVQRYGPPTRWLLSFHGLPQRTVRQGDPYPEECEATARALARRMQWREEEWEMAYQSRFGPEAWLTPATAERLKELGRAGVERLYLMTPGFTADCLETLEEIAVRGAALFQKAGGGEFRLLPSLNEHPAFVSALLAMAMEKAELL